MSHNKLIAFVIDLVSDDEDERNEAPPRKRKKNEEVKKREQFQKLQVLTENDVNMMLEKYAPFKGVYVLTTAGTIMQEKNYRQLIQSNQNPKDVRTNEDISRICFPLTGSVWNSIDEINKEANRCWETAHSFNGKRNVLAYEGPSKKTRPSPQENEEMILTWKKLMRRPTLYMEPFRCLYLPSCAKIGCRIFQACTWDKVTFDGLQFSLCDFTKKCLFQNCEFIQIDFL
mgnify:CR=1 FL=1